MLSEPSLAHHSSVDIKSYNTNTHSLYCIMQTHLQQPMPDRYTCQWKVQPGWEDWVLAVRVYAWQSTGAGLCVFCICVCNPRLRHYPYCFLQWSQKKGSWFTELSGTRMHDWLGLMEFSALDLHFSLSSMKWDAHISTGWLLLVSVAAVSATGSHEKCVFQKTLIFFFFISWYQRLHMWRCGEHNAQL